MASEDEDQPSPGGNEPPINYCLKLALGVDGAGHVTVKPDQPTTRPGAQVQVVVVPAAPYIGVCARTGVVINGNAVVNPGLCACHRFVTQPGTSGHLDAAAAPYKIGDGCAFPAEPHRLEHYKLVPVPALPKPVITPFDGTGDVHAGSGDP